MALLQARSKALWRELFQTDDAVPESSVAWQPSGSILLATSLAETEQLRKRQAMLGAAGIKAALMDEGQLRAEEPALGDAVESNRSADRKEEV
ncbi:hypothetical protein COCSUDRAFT_83474 [Coccomyxa subellipsoidea C-169]|uniref:Uncharacterized protein n=1 Tax=Coccomyxa subellipsoidea (strain C-169) TaxID=574566 RepID=I0YVU8_COCSC|nr:hypothetical protein COCSUDRAFT_83474 [Coccomyxa subellipsoidea C-169]EIE22517.1 hypothetical protein COCSUDRAFT_83474 [Coccomyxa subellipsoidea C-169]|eukprot:XP_005647061.1 hypothetical protein COCSUDRAFT_83474 [Coccomyxa subellipsoidea C-169]